MSFSPLGRGLLRYLKGRQSERAVNEQILGELEELRKVLAEVSERLDFTERRMAQDQLGLPRPPVRAELLPPPQNEAASTPH